jgi:hypothetical protein
MLRYFGFLNKTSTVEHPPWPSPNSLAYSSASWTRSKHATSRPTILLYCTALQCTGLHCTALYCTALYCTALYCTALYCTALYCSVLLCTALHCTPLYCTALHCTALYCSVLCCAVLCCAVLCCAVLHLTALPRPILYCTTCSMSYNWSLRARMKHSSIFTKSIGGGRSRLFLDAESKEGTGQVQCRPTEYPSGCTLFSRYPSPAKRLVSIAHRR